MRLLKSFATVGAATIASRILGFVREIMLVALLGAGPVTDAFYAAFRFPNLFRRLFAEGAFNPAFVPLFAKELEKGGLAAAQAFAREVFSVLFVVLLVLTALAEMAMPVLVHTVIAPGFDEVDGKSELTADLARIMFPYLFCMSLVALLSGVLNSLRRYFVAAFVPVVMNVVLIGVLALGIIYETGATVFTGYLIAWGVFVAGFLQLAMVWVAARKTGFRLQLSIPKLSPPVRRLLVLAIPAAIAGGITQINLLVGQIIASAQESAITYLQLSDRIYQLPLGVIGIAIGVVLLPELSRAFGAGDRSQAVYTQRHALEFSMFLTLPSAVALGVMPFLIVDVLYVRGAFTPTDAIGTAAALGAFAWGLPAFVLVKVLSPAFFAREDTRTPMLYAGVNAGINIVLSLILFEYFAHVGIAIATSVAAWANVILLATGLIRRGYWPFDWQTGRRTVLMLLGSAAMGVCLYAWLSFTAGEGLLDTASQRFGALCLAISGGATVYFVTTVLTRAVDLRQIQRNLRRSA
ncbi:MAG: murein biosynthesis integral membrane protein MurJ [Pseudomonadota bacterium]